MKKRLARYFTGVCLLHFVELNRKETFARNLNLKRNKKCRSKSILYTCYEEKIIYFFLLPTVKGTLEYSLQTIYLGYCVSWKWLRNDLRIINDHTEQSLWLFFSFRMQLTKGNWRWWINYCLQISIFSMFTLRHWFSFQGRLQTTWRT